MQFPRNDTLESSEEYLRTYVNCIVSQLIEFVKCLEFCILSSVIVLYLILCLSLYLILSNLDTLNRSSKGIKSKQRILFVTSHPDDECMFFAPAILNLTRQPDKNVFLLCLSCGDYYKQGKLRKEELWKSCAILGIPESNIFLQKVSALPDDPNVKWDENVIYNLVINYVESLKFDAVVTFDKDGVSGHSNHKSIYYGLANPVANKAFPEHCSVFCLDSVNKFRKYSIIFDLLLSICFSSNWFLLSPSECRLVKKALHAHKTQYLWYRKIYIWISRYAYMNTYSLLCANEAIFDIDYRHLSI